MTEPEIEVGIDGERAASPGQSLQAARLRQEMTVQQVALDLHLDTWVIDALEADDYSAIGAPVFAKGHLRQYGELLGLDPDELLIGYYQTRETPAEHPVVSEVLNRRDDPGPSLRWLLIVLLTILVAGAVVLGAWFLMLRAAPESEPAAGSAAQAPAAVVPEPATEFATAPSEPEPDPATLPESEQLDVTPPESAAPDVATAAEPPAGPEVTLQFSFVEDSWVEVYDAANNRIYFSLERQDTVATVSGIGPLRVFLGYAEGVTLDVNGRPFTIPRGGPAHTARFSVTGED